MTVFEWLFTVLGFPENFQSLYIFYILGGAVVLILLDGLINFLLGAIGSITYKGGRK